MIKILQILSSLNHFKVAVSERQIRRSIYNMTDLSENILKYHGKSTFQITPSTCNVIDRTGMLHRVSNLTGYYYPHRHLLRPLHFRRLTSNELSEGENKEEFFLRKRTPCIKLSSELLFGQQSTSPWTQQSSMENENNFSYSLCRPNTLHNLHLQKCWILPKFKKKRRWKWLRQFCWTTTLINASLYITFWPTAYPWSYPTAYTFKHSREAAGSHFSYLYYKLLGHLQPQQNKWKSNTVRVESGCICYCWDVCACYMTRYDQTGRELEFWEK